MDRLPEPSIIRLFGPYNIPILSTPPAMESSNTRNFDVPICPAACSSGHPSVKPALPIRLESHCIFCLAPPNLLGVKISSQVWVGEWVGGIWAERDPKQKEHGRAGRLPSKPWL